jgi:hypothetical protein
MTPLTIDIILTTVALLVAGGIIWKIAANRDQHNEDWDV